MTSDPEDVGSGTSLTARSPELDFSLVLSRVIGSVKDDPAQLRNAVYELARFKLQREAWHRHPPMSFVEICRMMRAFESAIARVETVSAKHDEIKALQSLDRLIESWEFSASTMVLAPQAPMLVIDQTAGATADVEPVPAMPALPRRASPKHASSKHASPNHFRGWQWPGAAQLVRGVVVMVVAAALCVVLDRQFGLLGRHGAPATASVPATPTSKTADARLPAAPSVPTAPALPLPDVYGVYALNNGRLHDSRRFPAAVPDPKVFMSTPIKIASRTVLSDGQVAFIVYRRDIAGNAPDRVAVRIIARVVRAMTFTPPGRPRPRASTTNGPSAAMPMNGAWRRSTITPKCSWGRGQSKRRPPHNRPLYARSTGGRFAAAQTEPTDGRGSRWQCALTCCRI
jgi:hypothetical protein